MNFMDPSAVVINPQGTVSLKLLETLITNGLAVTVVSDQQTSEIVSTALGNNPQLSFFITHDRSLPTRSFNYAVIFLDQNISTSKSLPDSFGKAIYVINANFGQKKINEISRQLNSRVVVVVEPPDQTSGSFSSQLFRSLSTQTTTPVNPQNTNLIFLADPTDTAQATLQALFTSPKPSLTWLIPKPIALNSFLEHLKAISSPLPKFVLDPTYRPTDDIVMPVGVPRKN
jgi:hypothetical protein